MLLSRKEPGKLLPAKGITNKMCLEEIGRALVQYAIHVKPETSDQQILIQVRGTRICTSNLIIHIKVACRKQLISFLLSSKHL